MMLGVGGGQQDLLYLAAYVHALTCTVRERVWLEEAKEKGHSCYHDINGYN